MPKKDGNMNMLLSIVLLFGVLLSTSLQQVLCLAVLADLGLRIMGVFIVYELLMYR